MTGKKYIDKAVLVKGYLPQDDVELPSGRGFVRVRALSRNEAVKVQQDLTDKDVEELEIRGCARGMLEPKLTEDEVRAWRENDNAADVQAIAKRISELSNMDPKGGKGPTSRSTRART